MIVKDDDVDIRKIIIASYNRSSVRGNYSESTRVILTSFRDGDENDMPRIFPKSWGFNSFPGIGNKKEISNFINDCKKSFGKIPTSFQSSTAPSNIEINGTHMDVVQKVDSGSAQISIQLGDEPKQLLIIDNNDDVSNSLRAIPCEGQKCSY